MAEIKSEKLLLKVPEAAQLLGIPRNRAYDWIRRKILPAIHDGGRTYVPRRAIENLVERIAKGELTA